MNFTQEALTARYQDLTAQRDAANAKITPLQEKLAKANEEVMVAQARAAALAEQIQAARGGEKWLALKKEIGMLATALSGKMPKAEKNTG